MSENGRARGVYGWRLLLPLLLAGALLAGCGLPVVGAASPSMARTGGTRIVLRLACPASQTGCDLSRDFGPTVVLLRRRLQEGLGLRAATLTALDASRVEVDLPGVHTATQAATQALDLLTHRGQVLVVDTGDDLVRLDMDLSARICAATCGVGQYPIAFTQAQFDPAQTRAFSDPQSHQPALLFGFSGAAQQRFSAYTRAHIGKSLTITLDGIVIEAATIQSEIDGQGQVTGLASAMQAQDLAIFISLDPLPLAPTLLSQADIAPSR